MAKDTTAHGPPPLRSTAKYSWLASLHHFAVPLISPCSSFGSFLLRSALQFPAAADLHCVHHLNQSLVPRIVCAPPPFCLIVFDGAVPLLHSKREFQSVSFNDTALFGPTTQFTSMDGFAHRPIVHTCNPLLELPCTYKSFNELAEEFTALL